MSAEVFRMLWVVAVPALFGEVFWFGEYGGVNEKQDNMVWAVFLMTVTFLIAGAFAMDHGYILTSVKKLLGIAESYTAFDADIIMHINAVFLVLQQLGVGPEKGFGIVDASAVWDDFLPGDERAKTIASYMGAKVRLAFDPPQSSTAMPNTFGSRLKHAWNAFLNRDPPRMYGGGYSYRPDRPRLNRTTDRTILTAIYARMAQDATAITINHVRLDKNDRFDAVLDSGLNSCLNLSANKDQTGRTLRYDMYLSLLDEGVIAIVPVDIDEDPVTGETEIRSMRVGKVKEWYPDDVRVELYNDRTGQKEEVILPKEQVAIVENPFYSVMNEPNSTVQRLISKLRIMDAVDEQAGSGKLDLIIQLPYTVKSPARKEQAQERRKTLEEQLAGSRYGIGYIDATEHITQLNRSLENNLLKSIEYLTNMAYSQLGLTPEIMNGTADDTVMTNYENRVIEPLVAAVVDELKRKFLSREDLKAKQSIMYFRDPFKLAPVSMVAEMADKFTRNEIMTSNEFRQVIGMKPSKDPKADQLLNKNLSPNAEQAAQIGSDPRHKRARGCGADGK